MGRGNLTRSDAASARHGGRAALARCCGASLFLLLGAGCGGSRTAGSIQAAPHSSPIRFEDVTARAGIGFRHDHGGDGRFRFPETFGSGCCFLDFDGDGRLDVFLVNSTRWPDGAGASSLPALYRNEGNGSFREVTRQAGLATPLYGMGCAVGDYDNDGDDDLIITCVGQNRLFRNQGTGVFQDVTLKSGLKSTSQWAWHTCAAWFDYNRDGLLDLFVGRYVKWMPGADPVCRSGDGKRTYCAPASYQGERNLVYRNLGNGRFADVSTATGIAGAVGRALGVLPLDYDGDGWCDLFITNDQAPNFLFKNREGRRFEEVAQESGVALSESGVARAGMGVDGADVRNDGGLALAVGNFSGEGLALFQRRAPTYIDGAHAAGLVPASLPRLTFGLVFVDADRDGWQDLFAYNGHVDPQVASRGAPVTYRQLPQLFRNEQGHFRDTTAHAGVALQTPQLGRGCAVGDFDNDGRPDLLLSENAGPAHLLRNTTDDHHHWLGIRLRGKASNRNGYGAELRLTAGGMTQRRWVRSGSSYLSHNDSRALFGLGTHSTIERLEVRWPTGRITVRERLPADQYIEVEEPPA